MMMYGPTNFKNTDVWKMDPGGGQDPDQTVELEKNVQLLCMYLTYMFSQQDVSFHNTPFKMELMITIRVSDRHDEQVRTEQESDRLSPRL